MNTMSKSINQLITVMSLLVFTWGIQSMEKRKADEPEEPRSTKKVAISSLEWQHQLANFDRLPDDLKRLILEKIIASSNSVQDAINEIAKIRLINKTADAFINKIETLKFIITKLAYYFSGRLIGGDPVTEANISIALFPLTDKPEIHEWIESIKPVILWRQQLVSALENKNLIIFKKVLEENQTIFKQNLNEVVLDGFLPLFYAIKELWPEAIKLLLENGADPNFIAPSGWFKGLSPLTYAGTDVWDLDRSGASDIYVNIIEILLKHGALINKVDGNGNLALVNVIDETLYSAASNYNETHTALGEFFEIEARKLIEFLLESGANPNGVSKKGYSPLFLIIMKSLGYPKVELFELTKLLMRYGANPHQKISISPMELHEFPFQEEVDVEKDNKMSEILKSKK